MIDNFYVAHTLLNIIDNYIAQTRLILSLEPAEIGCVIMT